MFNAYKKAFHNIYRVPTVPMRLGRGERIPHKMGHGEERGDDEEIPRFRWRRRRRWWEILFRGGSCAATRYRSAGRAGGRDGAGLDGYREALDDVDDDAALAGQRERLGGVYAGRAGGVELVDDLAQAVGVVRVEVADVAAALWRRGRIVALDVRQARLHGAIC